jgi:hypothetical protein
MVFRFFIFLAVSRLRPTASVRGSASAKNLARPGPGGE